MQESEIATNQQPPAAAEGFSSQRDPAYHVPMSAIRTSILLAIVAGSVALTGCVERTIRITSEPSGALVYLNDIEIGRTPCRTEFLHYGTYDVRLSLDGYESIMTSRTADTPVGEIPPIDLAAEVLPVQFRNFIDWHFTLSPTVPGDVGLIDRANTLRMRLDDDASQE
jgi:hypothetical protein